MRRVATTTALIATTGLLVAVLICAAGAQTEQPTGSAETFGALPDLVASAQVDALLRQHEFTEACAICQHGFDSATDDATRALALRGIGDTYGEEYPIHIAGGEIVWEV